MSDRLKELQRQRALAQEQLAWLDREIASETGKAETSSPVTTPHSFPATSPSPGTTSEATATAEAIIEKYQRTGPSVESQVKRGCFMYFFLALSLVGLGVAALYLYSVYKH